MVVAPSLIKSSHHHSAVVLGGMAASVGGFKGRNQVPSISAGGSRKPSPAAGGRINFNNSTSVGGGEGSSPTNGGRPTKPVFSIDALLIKREQREAAELKKDGEISNRGGEGEEMLLDHPSNSVAFENFENDASEDHQQQQKKDHHPAEAAGSMGLNGLNDLLISSSSLLNNNKNKCIFGANNNNEEGDEGRGFFDQQQNAQQQMFFHTAEGPPENGGEHWWQMLSALVYWILNFPPVKQQVQETDLRALFDSGWHYVFLVHLSCLFGTDRMGTFFGEFVLESKIRNSP
jgi:hypothetical protein